ncbi:hypothetical protein QCA50_018999 [Cerrena zonata]|uniref:Cohesin subunit SCC3/SA HEAT-repeats domain-containing protein n=1 Tax=Cerrena zonata TaxID=2478898 RepID=A0AAW0FBM2_9APHY
MLLVQWGKALDSNSGDDEADSDSESNAPSGKTKAKAVAALVSSKSTGRTGLAVEALWDEVEPVSDWETLLEVLLLDHSSGETTTSRGNKGKKKASDSGVDEAWRLEEVEEGVLLEVLIASLRRTKAEAVGAKKGEEETVTSDITRALIKALPRLFMKYQTDESRMANVMLIPQLMNLNEYLEMRMMTAYSTLWDDITKQFLSHSSSTVLTNAVTTIRYMMDTTSLSNTNSTKILELEDELSNSLREAISGGDELEVASFDEDEVLALSAVCSRIATLAGTRDMISWMEEDEGGKQSSAWDIVSALAERGRLGYKEEEAMIDHALQVLYLHILWKARVLTASPDPTPDEIAFRDKLKEQRDSLLEKLLEFAIGTQSNTAEGVRRSLYRLTRKYRHAVQVLFKQEIESYAEELESESPRDEDSDSDKSGSDSDQDENAKTKKSKKGKGKEVEKSPPPGSKASILRLEKEYIFIGVIATFLRAIKAGAIDFRHAATLLSHYGRLGAVFDMCSKVIVDILRDEGMYKDNGDAVVAVILQALQDSFTLYLDGVAHTEEHSIALAKLLSTCFIIRGAQLSVVRRLDPKHVVEVHTSALTWIGKRLGAYEAAKNKKGRAKASAFFKCLTPLCAAIDGKDFLKIKAHLEQILAQAKVEVLPTAKAWDAYRAYDKRLTTGKDKAAGGKRASKRAANLEAVTTEDEGGLTTGDEALVPAPSKPRPKPRRPRRSTRGAQSGNEDEPELDEPDNPPSEPEPEFTTPKQNRRRAASESTPQSPIESAPASPLSSQAAPSSPFMFETPGTSKRKRSSDGSGSEPEPENDELPEHDDEDRLTPAPETPKPSQEQPSEEIRIRRKRVRH